MKKLFICIILIFISFSCNEKTKLNKNKNNKNVSHEETILQIEDDSFSMKDYINTIQSVNENGGIAIYDSGVFYEVPNEFKVESVKIFGIPGEYYPPENPITQIQIQPDYDPIEWDRLHIQIPIEIYEKYPNQYLEAEHEGKIFFYSNKNSLKYIETKNNENELLGYHVYIPFVNRNLYSNDNKFILRLRNTIDNSILSEEIIIKDTVNCDYVVYIDEYESPFKELDNNNINANEKIHLIYKNHFGEQEMIIFSFGYYDYKKISYIPFTAIKANLITNNVCSLDFSIREPGQYKIDFYDVKTKQIHKTSNFDYISVKRDNIQHIEKSSTAWLVNSIEGLRIRTSPWGEKIGLLEHQTELYQTEDSLYPFYDEIDNIRGFWIPVKVVNNIEYTNKHNVICEDESQTDGWVFSGYLIKKGS